MALGGRIRAERKAQNLSQEALARRADVSMNVIARLERGVITDPHYSSLSNIAQALGLSIGELVGEPELAGKVEAPPETEEVEERRGIVVLSQWIDYIDRRAQVFLDRAKKDENPYLETWQLALQWDSDVSEEAFDIREAAEKTVQRLMKDGTARGAAAYEIQNLEAAYRRLQDATRAVGAKAQAALDRFVGAHKETSSLLRKKQEVAQQKSVREAGIAQLQARRGA